MNIGLDSLVSIELKNWMVRTFQVVLQASEIAGAASIIALGKTLAGRSKLVPDSLKVAQPEAKQVEEKTQTNGLDKTVTNGDIEHTHGFNCCKGSKELPRFPLVDFDDAMEQLYSNVSPHAASEEERANLRAAVEEFLKTDSIPRRTYSELRKKADDPNCESWIADLLLRALFLERRFPLAPNLNFVGTHKDSAVPHSQALRAAIITTTALRFKQKLDAGTMEPEVFSDISLCMYSWDWMFNAVREPNLGCDKMQRYPGNDYIVVLRRGRVFPVQLVENGENVSFEKLQATFQTIGDLELDEKDDSWAGILTTDERDSWAKVSSSITISETKMTDTQTESNQYYRAG
jgi:hypothetical protein